MKKNNYIQIGKVSWSLKEIYRALPKFVQIYKGRPVKDNQGGMKTPHLFATWFFINKIKPKYIIESGVWKGQGTWIMEKASPKAKIYCIDPELSNLVYKSKKASYSTVDFAQQDWIKLPKDKTVVFFDDHQNALTRLKQARKLGFKHLIFEDNYPPSRGDIYSLKKAFMRSGHTISLWEQVCANITDPAKILHIIKLYLNQAVGGKFVEPNSKDEKYLNNNVKVYYEFPPVFKSKMTRWGDCWDEKRYPTKPPLFNELKAGQLKSFYEEAKFYTWICYVRLK